MAIEQQSRMSSTDRIDRWNDEQDKWSAAWNQSTALTKEQAQALRARLPSVSPWWVVLAQFWVGATVALLAALLTGKQVVLWSALYGAATVVVPGALMARGMTSKLGRASPVASAAGFMVWEMVKIGVTVAMLMLAPKVVQPLSWPALLVGLVVCIKVYWLALLWRGRVVLKN